MVDVVRCSFIITGLVILNIVPYIITENYAGFLLSLGVIFFVNGVVMK
ncbi:MAG: hypothetical protein IJH63_10360 [Methanobrevibacter sp.]|nr:hypothetical protein [Methanosphaera sp.]MBR0371102.1 hypothetical protein [Methanobrevibacter sp.]